jgi:hypothetical protein
MQEIKPPFVTIDELKVEKLGMGQKLLDLSFKYTANGKQTKIFKQFPLAENNLSFVLNLISEVKKSSNLKLEKEEEMKEKLVNYLGRLVQEVKSLEKFQESERYMREFQKINCYKVNFPEVAINMGSKTAQRWA